MVVMGRGSFQPRLPAEMRRLERLNGVLPNGVFERVEQFSGLTDTQLKNLLNVREGRLSDAIAQLNRGEDENAIANAVARFNKAKGEDGNTDRKEIGDLLAEANHGELLLRIPVYKTPEGELTSNASPCSAIILCLPLNSE